jgi:hypothetical protein
MVHEVFGTVVRREKRFHLGANGATTGALRIEERSPLVSAEVDGRREHRFDFAPEGEVRSRVSQRRLDPSSSR